MSERAESTETTFWASGDARRGLACYRTLVETVDGGVFQLDADDRIVAIDDALIELTGHTRETLLDANVSILFDDDDSSRVIQHVRAQAAGSAEVDSLAIDVRTADGSLIACELRLNGVPTDEPDSHSDTTTNTDSDSNSTPRRRHHDDTGVESDGERNASERIEDESARSRTTIGILRERQRGRDPDPDSESTREEDVSPDDAAPSNRSTTGPVSGPAATDSPEPLVPVLEEADVGVFVLDDQFDVAWINDAAERYFGIDREDVVGRNKRRVIADAIEDRVADHEQFREDVLATYDDNCYVERFECRITPSDREDRAERWLEHRSQPIESGPYAGGRVELYYDVTDQRRRVFQLRRLNAAVRDWLEADSRERAAERACRSLRDILGLEINGIFQYETDGDALRPIALSEPGRELFDEPPTFGRDEGIAWRVYDTGQPEIYGDVRADPDVYNPDTPIRSEIILPIGDHGILMAGSQRHDAFDEGDLSLAKIAASSLEATFDRIDNEHRLARERSQTEELIRTAPVAISVEDAAGETILENRRAAESTGLPARRVIEEALDEANATAADDVATAAEDAAWTVSDADGNPLDADRTPSARVRETGESVFDEEISVDGPDGERRWFSVNAAPVCTPDGTLERVISVGEDITELKAHERELERRKHELETELSEILGRVSDAFCALDEDFRFTHVNDRAAEIVDRSEANLLGRRLWEVYDDVDVDVDADIERTDADELVSDRFREAMTSQQRVNFETYAETLDAWLEFNLYPSATGLSVYFRDVTERKERERDLATYETVVETIEDGIYVLDEDERFTAVNDAYTTLTGYDREELIGAHASLVADEDTVELAREVAVDEADVPTIDAELLTRSGETIPIEASVTTLTTEGAGTSDDESAGNDYGEGHHNGRIGVVRDVTERRRRQRKLAESEQRYRTFAENFPNGVVALFDEDLRYTAAGGQLIDELGVDRECAVGRTIYERYEDDVVEEVEPHFRAALAGEERDFEITYCDRELRARTLPVRTGDEVQTGMLVVQDVTERREYERRLEASNERLEQFAYAASHDLQEPLRMISSYLQLIDQRYGEALDADGREFLAYAVDGAERMKEMIDGLLEYSRVETQGDPLEPVELGDVLDDVREDLQLRIEESDAEVTVATLPRVRGDVGQLRQLFQNLLSNAIEYSGEEPPQVRVTAEQNGSTWTITVADDGIGIDPADQERVFEVFERLHSRNEHPGTGIGLSLCKRIVERHDGEIRLDSEPGAGTTISCTLPAADD